MKSSTPDQPDDIEAAIIEQMAQNQIGGSELINQQQRVTPPTIADTLSNYLSVDGSASGNPMRRVGSEGVKERNFEFEGGAEARVPIDNIIQDALIRLAVDGFAYGGKAKLPQKFQEEGAPASIKYGDKGFTNLGIGLEKGGLSAGLNYNPQTDSKGITARYKFNF